MAGDSSVMSRIRATAFGLPLTACRTTPLIMASLMVKFPSLLFAAVRSTLRTFSSCMSPIRIPNVSFNTSFSAFFLLRAATLARPPFLPISLTSSLLLLLPGIKLSCPFNVSPPGVFYRVRFQYWFHVPLWVRLVWLYYRCVHSMYCLTAMGQLPNNPRNSCIHAVPGHFSHVFRRYIECTVLIF